MIKHTFSGSRRRAAWMVVLIVVICSVMLGSGIWVWATQPIQKPTPTITPLQIPVPTETSQATAQPTPTTSPQRECRPGTPVSYTYPALGITNLPVVELGVDSTGVPVAPPEDPEGRKEIAIFRMPWHGGVAGHLPGEGKGNIISGGHTFLDGTGAYPADADSIIAVGQQFWYTMDNGSACEYRITQVWHQLAKYPENADATHPYFDDVEKQEGFYDLNWPTERVFGMTCSGAFDPSETHHLYETAWFATPIN